jgi:hypothetical protein
MENTSKYIKIGKVIRYIAISLIFLTAFESLGQRLPVGLIARLCAKNVFSKAPLYENGALFMAQNALRTATRTGFEAYPGYSGLPERGAQFKKPLPGELPHTLSENDKNFYDSILNLNSESFLSFAIKSNYGCQLMNETSLGNNGLPKTGEQSGKSIVNELQHKVSENDKKNNEIVRNLNKKTSSNNHYATGWNYTPQIEPLSIVKKSYSDNHLLYIQRRLFELGLIEESKCDGVMGGFTERALNSFFGKEITIERTKEYWKKLNFEFNQVLSRRIAAKCMSIKEKYPELSFYFVVSEIAGFENTNYISFIDHEINSPINCENAIYIIDGELTTFVKQRFIQYGGNFALTFKAFMNEANFTAKPLKSYFVFSKEANEFSKILNQGKIPTQSIKKLIKKCEHINIVRSYNEISSAFLNQSNEFNKIYITVKGDANKFRYIGGEIPLNKFGNNFILTCNSFDSETEIKSFSTIDLKSTITITNEIIENNCESALSLFDFYYVFNKEYNKMLRKLNKKNQRMALIIGGSITSAYVIYSNFFAQNSNTQNYNQNNG